MKRVIAYVDGFNLYFGMREKRWRRYYWLNVQVLARKLLKADQQLVFVKYFTSLVSGTPRDPHKRKRQGSYLDALGTLRDFRILRGHYLHKQV